MPDLSLVPVTELVDELLERCETGVVFIALNGDEQICWNWQGQYYKALGMCDEIKANPKRNDRRYR